MRFTLFCLGFLCTLWGNNAPLFGSVEHIAKDDTLNVRVAPSPKAKKVASLPLHAYVGIDACQKRGISRWCKIHHIAQRDYEGYGWDAPEGWVNARYLSLGSRGYVLVDGTPNCDYVLGCKNGKCDLVVDYEDDENDTITALKTKKIARSRLSASSNFGAMNPEADGYCVLGSKIEDYLRTQRLRVLSNDADDPAYQKAFLFLQRFDLHWVESMVPFIHPEQGLRVGYQTHFSQHDNVVFPEELATMEERQNKRLFWGEDEASGEKILKSLYDVMWEMRLDLMTLKEVQSLPTLRGFPCHKGDVCKGYVFYSYERPREEDLGWQGLVVIVKKIGMQWYVVGVLRDRWEI